MAAVTLKDLMDPLSKIAAAAEATNEKLDAFVAMATGATGGAGLEQAIYTQLETQTTYLKLIYENTKGRGLGGIFSGKSSKKEVSSAGKTLEALGLGAKATAQGMLLWMLVPSKAVNKFIDFVTRTYEALAEQDQKKVKEGVNILDMMGGAIKSFALGLAVSALVIIPSMIAIPFLTVSIAAMGLVFTLLGKRGKDIKKGAKAVDKMGDAMKSFAIGLAFFALTAALVIMAPIVLVGMVASLVLIGGTFALLGSKGISKNISKGAAAVALIGLGLIVFSVGLGIFRLATAGMGLMDVLIQSAVILGVGVATALVGAFGLGPIAAGALSLALNGIGLLVFSLGYVPFAKATEGMGLKDILIQSGILLGIGAVMALGGLAVAATGGAALLGPVLFAAAGASLLLLAPGLQVMKNLDYSEADAKDLAITLGAVAMAFSGINPDSGPFGMIGGLFTRVVQSGSGVAAAAMYAAAGIALQELAKGLTDFKAIGFTEDDSKELAVALGAVSGAFAQAGGEPASPGGLFGAVFGNMFSPNAVERGIDSVMGAGKALIDVTKGLAAFIDLKNKYGLTPESFQEGGYLNVAVSDTLSFVSKAFASIGGMETEDSWGPFKWDENLVEKGVDAVKGAGTELINIANGLKSFQELIDKDIDFSQGGKLATAVTNSLTFVGEAFASIGSGENEQEDGWFIFKWDENKIKKGIDAIGGAGKELTNIANGLKTFQELIDKDIDWDKLKDAVTTSVTLVGEAFASIGSGENEQEDGWFVFKWDENKIKKGIDAVSGAGKELTNIAQGLMKFQELKDPDKVAEGIKSIFTSIGDTFMYYYEKEEFKNHLDHMSGFITELSMNAKKGYLEKAADGMEKIAEAVNSIQPNKAEAFAKLFSSAGTLSSNRTAQKELIEAIKEIKDILKGEGGEGSEGGGILDGVKDFIGGGGDRGEDRGRSDARLNATLSRIDSTLSRLPSQIQAIKIEVSPDYN